MRYTAYIGLGSNLASVAGSPAETVIAAIGALSALGTVAAQSSLYRTAPIGYREQPYFINAAVCLETELEPERLLEDLLGMERSFGRDRRASVPKGPRTLDLDILLVWKRDGKPRAVVSTSPALKLPHPEIANRRFVLEPFAEIAPNLRHPVLHRTVQELLRAFAVENGDKGDEVARL
ncbi:MAG TPA: 2-amino-4-hydroxy-6-hydroxymethyldihydropteridine diphosphokinase [Silvibacterium sp.]|nr:2-amino-4-hydroxy-6-hydroxymethyldihydropteridine diphosphokinase [Silvibacterium sp.]